MQYCACSSRTSSFLPRMNKDLGLLPDLNKSGLVAYTCTHSTGDGGRSRRIRNSRSSLALQSSRPVKDAQDLISRFCLHCLSHSSLSSCICVYIVHCTVLPFVGEVWKSSRRFKPEVPKMSEGVSLLTQGRETPLWPLLIVSKKVEFQAKGVLEPSCMAFSTRTLGPCGLQIGLTINSLFSQCLSCGE